MSTALSRDSPAFPDFPAPPDSDALGKRSRPHVVAFDLIRGAPHRKFFAAGSASSFGIYLAHPLVLQALLALATATGVLAAVRSAPVFLEVLVLLGVFLPLVYGVSWVIASLARRTPLSLALTGREYAPARRKERRARS
ncbi:MAG TPA: hypothetical protein VF482_13325 [Trebonia sp.]